MEFMNWAYLGTFAGALVAVGIITELIKNIPGINKVPTQIMSWIIALAVLICASAFTGGLTAEIVVLDIINAAMVSLAANGGYDAIKRIETGTKSEKGED